MLGLRKMPDLTFTVDQDVYDAYLSICKNFEGNDTETFKYLLNNALTEDVIEKLERRITALETRVESAPDQKKKRFLNGGVMDYGKD